MSNRSAVTLLAVISLLAAAFLAINNIVKKAALADWWLPLLLLGIGAGAALWGWMRTRAEESFETTTTPTEARIHVPPPAYPTPPITEVAVTDAVEVSKPRATTELLPQVEPENVGLSAEEMAIFKPNTPHVTSNLDESTLGEAVRKAEALHAEKEKDETVPMRPNPEEKEADATHPMRPDIIPGSFSAEEMAIQKPPTAHATESFDDAAINEAVEKAKVRARTIKGNEALSAEQMANEKPETDASTRKISRDLLPPTSTREMASNKPMSEVSTHEMEGTGDAVSEEIAKMADEKPFTPLSTIEESIEPGTLPIDTPLIDMPAPSTLLMEVEAAPVEKDPHISDTMEVTTAEVAAEGALNKDDLQRIEGIGLQIAALLIAEGISTFSRLATTPEEELREILKKAELRLAPTLTTWAAQAAIAARGDWDALKVFQDELGKRE